MRINDKIFITFFSYILALAPGVGISQTHNCEMISETDTRFGNLAHELNQYVTEAEGLAICTGQRSSASLVVPVVVTRIMEIKSVRTFQIESPYIYRERFPENSNFREYLGAPPFQPSIRFICLIRNQCDRVFDRGFVIVDEDIEENQYPVLASLWERTDLVQEIETFDGRYDDVIYELKKFTRSGGTIFPLGMTPDFFAGRLRGLHMWVYGLQENGSRREWRLVLNIEKDKFTIVEVAIGELE